MYRCRFKAKSDHAKYEKSKCLFLFSFYRFHNFAIVSLVGYFLATHFGESDSKFFWFIVKICCFFCCIFAVKIHIDENHASIILLLGFPLY